MATYITDRTSLAQFNAGLPPDEQASGFYLMTAAEQAKWERDTARAISDMRLREWHQARAGTIYRGRRH